MQEKSNSMLKREKVHSKIDNLVVVYVGVVLFFQTLLQISPIVTFLAATPLYSIQTYFGVLGGVLILVLKPCLLWQSPPVLTHWLQVLP